VDPRCAGEKNALQEAIVGAVTAGPPELQAQVRVWTERGIRHVHQHGDVHSEHVALPADHSACSSTLFC